MGLKAVILKEKDYKMLSKLHKIGLIRQLKMTHKNEEQVILSDTGLVLGSLLCDLRGNFRYVKHFAIGYW